MSNTLYPDLENKFPVEIDDFDKFLDPSVSMMAAIQQYKNFYNQGNISAAVTVLEQNPDLKRCIMNADNMNKLRDAIISVQRYYLDDVQEYLVNIIKWKGSWSDTTTYDKYNVVSYARKDAIETFMAIAPRVPAGKAPTNMEYWVPITLRGEQGASGTGLSGRGNWKSTAQYYVDDWVAYNDTIWAAKNDNFNSEPHDNSEDWYPVIRDQQHYVISQDEPDAQYTGDIWYEILDDGTIQPRYKQEDGSYAVMNFAASSITMADGSTLDSKLRTYAKTKVLNCTIPASSWVSVSGYDDLFKHNIASTTVTDLVQSGRTRIDLNMDYALRFALEDFGAEELWVENQNGTVVVFERGIKLTDDVDVQLTLIDIKQ